MSTGFASADFDAVGYASGSFEAVDHAIDAGAHAAFSFLERLVAAPSTVGQEAEAQEIVATELARLGFDVSTIPVPPDTAAGTPGGVAQASYAGRHDVLGTLNPGARPTLLLNGHVDVVPAETSVWSAAPFAPRTVNGWMTGRGAGDMKGGFSMGLLAIEALRAAMPGAVTYLNQFGRPALAYGPRARNIHAADEAVELASIVGGTRTLARFIARYFAAGGP